VANRELIDAIQCNRICRTHRTRFVELLEEGGLHNAAAMERVQRRFVRAVIDTYPHGYMLHIHHNSCIGCDIEKWGPQSVDWAVGTLRNLAQQQLTAS
jgi:hypothetical protein